VLANEPSLEFGAVSWPEILQFYCNIEKSNISGNSAAPNSSEGSFASTKCVL